MARMRVDIDIDETRLRAVLEGPNGPVAYNLRQRAKRTATRARQLAPGSMKRKITTSTATGHVRVECSHPATMYVINGTRRHIIRPRHKQALKFKIGARTVFAKVVHHPGTKPNNFLLKALREASTR